jgi:excinuclease ABC subunit B
MVISLKRGESIRREDLLLKLIDVQYKRNDISFTRGTFRVRGDVIEIWPASEEISLRVELFGDEIDNLSLTNPLTGEVLKTNDELFIYPAKHFVTPENRMKTAVEGIKKELDDRLDVFKKEGKLLEAQRLAARTKFDIEMLIETGHCPGVENYARWFSGRNPGEPPYTLMDFFPEDFLIVVDESHVTVPQVRGMYAGDFSRKTTLVDHGFRLPSALDNRPFRFEEWEGKSKRILFMSATPAEYELSRCKGEVVEQVIRPTGLVDPILHVRPAKGQVADLVKEIKIRVDRKERVLVTTLTKRMAEDLTRFFQETGMRCKWLHSELDAIERIKVLRELREGAFDVLVGINLLREGLDLPEVSLVAILDADKEGFLRSETSLIQTIGRAARNVNAEVILYGDRVTNSMHRAIEETKRRRELQTQYNLDNNITPQSIKSLIPVFIEDEIAAYDFANKVVGIENEDQVEKHEVIEELQIQMLKAAEDLEFEKAAQLRDKIATLKGEKVAAPQIKKKRFKKR